MEIPTPTAADPLRLQIPGPGGRTVHIRPAVAEDGAAVVAHLTEAAASSAYLPFGAEGPGRTAEEQGAQLAGMASADNALALVAECEGQVVGLLTFAGGTRARTRHAGEFGVTVSPGFRGAGIGRGLIEALLAWARRGGVIRKVNLRVSVANEGAADLYRRMGFVTEGRTTRDLFIDGRLEDAWWMGMEVDP